MKKRILCVTIALVMVFSISGNVFATNDDLNTEKTIIGPCGDSMTDKPISIEDQKQAVINDSSMSDQEKARFLQRIEEHEDLVNGNIITPRAANDEYGYISVPYFKQTYDNYCGPATTKQTVHYINGSSASQVNIASLIGTTTKGSNLPDMQTYINTVQTSRDYIIVTSPSEDLIQSIVEYSVRNDAPTVCRLKITKGGNWLYSSSGHYMNLSGFEDYGESIRVTDPYLGWVTTTTNGRYFVTSNEIYTATNNHTAKQIMY